MNALIGLLLIIAGVALGLYVGVWVCFIGGVVQIVEAVKATPVEAVGIAVGILRIFFAGAAGFLSAIALVLPGFGMLTKSNFR